MALSIIDPEVNWKATNSTFLELEAKKAKKKQGGEQVRQDKEEDEDIEITIDMARDISLQADFLPFPAMGSKNSDSVNSDSDSDGDSDVGVSAIEFEKY